MSPSVQIVKRTTSKGEPRYIVRYRRGGRHYPLVHAGSFKTQKDARTRRDFVAGELAAGRDPRETLDQAARTAPAETVTYAAATAAFLEARIDIEDSSVTTYRHALNAYGRHLGEHTPVDDITADRVAAAVVALTGTHAPSTIKTYTDALRVMLDHAGADPNPARDKRVRLPRRARQEVTPPSSRELLAILDHVDPATALLLVALEQTGMRITEALLLEWGDVDQDGSRFRLRARTTKSGHARWVQVPAWLMATIRDRRHGDRVFVSVSRDQVRQRMKRACEKAGVPVYSPHDLRHRRATLWHGQGVTMRELQERIGHADVLLTLRTYTHVVPIDEVPAEQLAARLVMHP